MLNQLLPLLKKGDTIGLSIGMEGENQYRINVLPKFFTLDGENGKDRKALNTPLSVTGTAEDFTSPAFVETITRFTTSNTELRHTIDTVESEHKAAAVAKRAAPAAKAAPSKATPAAKPKPGAAKANWKNRLKKGGKAATVAEKPEPGASSAADTDVDTQVDETVAEPAAPPTPPKPPANAEEATGSLI